MTRSTIDAAKLTWWQRFKLALQGHTGGCNGKPYHNGMCECECRLHYLGL